MDPTLRILTSGPSHFFGFHDLTPWNTHTDELICLRTETLEDHVPTYEDQAQVVVINETDEREALVGETHAWNWQKGARQRWLPALGRRIVAYNAANPNGFECRIINLDTAAMHTLPLALYDICDHEGFGLSLNFSRLFRCQSGYGYDHKMACHGTDYDRDGIFRVELVTGKVSLILSLADFLREVGLDLKHGGHYFTHVQISPDGRRFVFMHRCFLSSGGLVNHLVLAMANGSSFRVLLDDKMSHFDWRDSDTLIVWCRQNKIVKRLKESTILTLARTLYRLSRKIRVNAVRQSLYNESFRQIDVNTGKSASIGRGILSEDGHPQVNPLRPDLWVSDTYPDPAHAQTLILYNQAANRRVDLLRLRTQPEIQETSWRCDLHPRWEPRGQRVCVDSAHLGRRQLCVLDISKEIGTAAEQNRRE